MNARKCDRCGDFYLPENGVKNYSIVWRGMRGEQKMDLCPACEEKLKEWAEKFIDKQTEGGMD